MSMSPAQHSSMMHVFKYLNVVQMAKVILG